MLAPLLSSNMVDKNIGLPAMMSNNVYLYKNKVVIPLLVMQEDTLGISTCGYRFRKKQFYEHKSKHHGTTILKR